MTKKSLKRRIAEALYGAPKGLPYYALMSAVFPATEYPKAMRYSSHGGPPGCAMAFGKALRELGVRYGKVSDIIYYSPKMIRFRMGASDD